MLWHAYSELVCQCWAVLWCNSQLKVICKLAVYSTAVIPSISRPESVLTLQASPPLTENLHSSHSHFLKMVDFGIISREFCLEVAFKKTPGVTCSCENDQLWCGQQGVSHRALKCSGEQHTTCSQLYSKPETQVKGLLNSSELTFWGRLITESRGQSMHWQLHSLWCQNEWSGYTRTAILPFLHDSERILDTSPISWDCTTHTLCCSCCG